MTDRVPYEITGHALERLEERFPNEYPDTDEGAGRLIQAEIEDALAHGRWGRTLPPEFELDVPHRWTHEFCVTTDGRRCYVIRDDGSKVKVITTMSRFTRPHRLVRPVDQASLSRERHRGAY